MARRRGLIATIEQMQRDAARAEAARQRARAAAQREAQRARAAYERAAVADERERKRLYVESRTAEVAAMNDDLARTVTDLESVLAATIDVDNHFDLEQLKQPIVVDPFDPGPLGVPAPVPREAEFLPAPPRGVSRMLGGARHEEQARLARTRYEWALADHAARERTRVDELGRAEQEHRRRRAEVLEAGRRQHAEIDALSRDLRAGAPDAVVAYMDLVLNASAYPVDFPQHWRLAYVPESRQLVVEYALPGLPVVPTVKAYRYAKATDSITESPRPQAQIKALYASVIAQVALRVVDEVFEADRLGHVESVVLNGMVDTTDPATGRSVRPCLLTVRTTRESFAELDLTRVDPAACLRHLGAGVSRSPSELTPVRPVLEFDMVDPRFVEETDVLAGLDRRPNLLEMSPGEFESLVQNLFSRMGLDTRQTRASRDGGVDCVAFDPRPIMGGKVVIQAKRYKNTVGVSAVRDLFGTLQNEGASKGILVTTSGYGQASVDFASGKPIELLDGANLLYLLREHAGIEARIEAPQDWRDPVADAPAPAAEPAAAAAVPLRSGQNVPIPGAAVALTVCWRSAHDIDVSGLLLDASGAVRSDADFVFYNQPVSADGAVRYEGASASEGSLLVDLSRVDEDVDRIVAAVSVAEGTFGDVDDLGVSVESAGDRWRYAPTASVETALVCAELYRRQGRWRLRAVGQGYRDGLAGVARDFGVAVDS